MAQFSPNLEPTTERRGALTEAERAERRSARLSLGGSSTEAIAGGGAAVLAVLGLLDIFPLYMASIAAMAVGLAVAIEGASIAARLSQAHNGGRLATTGGGITAELLGGSAGLVLGVLSLIGIMPWTLLPVASIVMGAAILIGAGASERIESVFYERAMDRDTVHQAVNTTQGARVLVGLGAATLGVLVLVGIGDTAVLTLAAFLALGVAQFLFGSTFSARVAKVLYQLPTH